MNGFARAKEFHAAFGITPVANPREPSVEDRVLRAKLMIEELFETVEKGLGIRIYLQPQHAEGNLLRIEEGALNLIPWEPYDPVETLDGLADLKVVANGTAVHFGLPMDEADDIVFESNMSKLDDDGRPIINGVTPGYRNAAQVLRDADDEDQRIDEDEEGFDPTKPIGKVLKSVNWIEAGPKIVKLIDKLL